MPRDDEDRTLWQAYARNVKRAAGVSAVKAARRKKPPVKPILAPSPIETESDSLAHLLDGNRRAASVLNPAQQSAVAAAKADLRQPPFLGKSREKALRQGEIEIEARIDLHGMTQARAQTALARFIAAQVKTKRRHVLIITGKGRAGSGILRANLAGWLESLPEAACILALRPAALRHGGDGAWYVILRARRG